MGSDRGGWMRGWSEGGWTRGVGLVESDWRGRTGGIGLEGLD